MPAPAPLHTVPATAVLAAAVPLARGAEPAVASLATADGPEGRAGGAPAEAARPEPATTEGLDLDRALHRAWYARLRPADPAELAAVDALVAGVSRRRRIDRLEERLLEALADGVTDSLRALAALARCRARIERDRRLLLEELRLLRDPARLPLRTARPRPHAARGPAASRHAAPEPGLGPPAAADPGPIGKPSPAPADRACAASRASTAAARGAATAASRPTAACGPAKNGAARHTAPEPHAGGRPGPLPPGAFVPDPIALAVAEAFPSPRRDFHRLPDWRDRTSALALEIGRMAAGCGRA